MDRRHFLSISSIGVSIGTAGCIADTCLWNANQDSSPYIEWQTGQGHTSAHGGDWAVIFDHEGCDTIDTSESTIKPVHDDKGQGIDRNVHFMNHESGKIYSRGDNLVIVIPESEPTPEFGESFTIMWTTEDETEWYTIGEHLWGQNYRDDVP